MYGDDYDFTQDAPKVVSREASEYVVTHPGRSQYSQAGRGVSACGIATLNCARIVLGLHAGGLDIEQLVLKIMGRQLLEVSPVPLCITRDGTNLVSFVRISYSHVLRGLAPPISLSMRSTKLPSSRSR